MGKFRLTKSLTYDLRWWLSRITFGLNYAKQTNSIWVGYGGGGSTALCRDIGAFPRPDTLYYADLSEIDQSQLQAHHPGLICDQGLNSIIRSQKIIDDTNRRTLYQHRNHIQVGMAVNDLFSVIIKRQLDFKRPIFFNNLFMLNFFSKNAIPDVNFLIRDPYAGYLSFAKKKRHRSQINCVGGYGSESSLLYWSEIFNRLVLEAWLLHCYGLKPKIHIYEDPVNNKRVSEFSRYAFRNWSIPKCYEISEPRLNERLKELTEDSRAKLKTMVPWCAEVQWLKH